MASAARLRTVPPEPSHHDRRRMFLDAGRMYLRILFELEEEGLPARHQELWRRLGASRPTVWQQVDRLVLDGLVEVTPEKHLVLTPRGRADAAAVIRKHRLAETFLLEVVGLPWDLAHVEASRWQHVIGAEAERKMSARLGDPTWTPFGTPIPPVGAAGHEHPGEVGPVLVPLADAVGDETSRVTLRRVPERLQTDRDLLVALEDAGALPGETVAVVRADRRTGDVQLTGTHGSVVVPGPVARSLLVSRLPARRRAPRRRQTR
ncbi:metal-dependent transcriptional regulator [Actinomycetospora straminea]|uniref:Iron-dependent transcriptional regulator IdeR n=1 Tax=Actinomycetospora straminea TaxID=663607 RepID=A0ABP9ECB6_9PSEU|nr:metal-dependent transcriptional regulator [Actinomycetospora straminea]MDD7932726.1 metal-dependent transcriptional regulator [Actinomycetospora straminea]